MPTMAPARAAGLHACRVRLTNGTGRGGRSLRPGPDGHLCQGRPVAGDAAVLLTSELAANAIRHAAGEAVTPERRTR